MATPENQTEQDVQTRNVEGDTVDSWLEIDSEGNVTVYAGKVELGTGLRTALTQIVAEELDVAFERVTMIMGDTALTPNQGVTAGSKSIQVAGPVLRQAAAEARLVLLTAPPSSSASQPTTSRCGRRHQRAGRRHPERPVSGSWSASPSIAR